MSTTLDTPGLALTQPTLPPWLGRVGWAVVSIGMFAGIWELLWAVGWADPRLLPPPHVFMGSIADQAKFFNTISRWQVGVGMDAGPPPALAVVYTAAATIGRVLSGLVIASVLSVSIGVAVRYFLLFERLTLPTITLLAPVSPIAWLPVAIFMFGIGNRPAIFMVVVALLFHMTLSTIAQIDGVNRNFINVARTMGASKRQIYTRVIVPAILPGMLLVLRMNLFAAWMAVLIAESTGVGYGLGQVIMLARNTFNPSLVFFTIALIGVLGFSFDFALRLLQSRLLYWVPKGSEALRGL
jgi:NitT/TauT family transport system permease protein